MSPATPAVASVCPSTALPEVTTSGAHRPIAPPYTALRARSSMGSPSAVPVSCASTTCTSAGLRSASRSACRTALSCTHPLGVVSELARAAAARRCGRARGQCTQRVRPRSGSRTRASLAAPAKWRARAPRAA